MVARLLGGIVLALCAQVALACDWEGAQRAVIDDSVSLLYRFEPSPPAQGRFISLTLAICADGALRAPEAVDLDARMPAHGHGMYYRPKVTAPDKARVEVSGLMLHMRGLWRFDVAFTHRQVRKRVSFDIQVP